MARPSTTRTHANALPADEGDRGSGRLEKRVGLITGSTSGIGRAIAQAFASEGADVIVSGRNDGDGERIATDLRKTGASATYVHGDVGSLVGVRELAERAIAAYGHVDILVNCAGVFSFAPTADTEEAAYDQMMAINLKGPFFLTAILAPQMAERGRGKVVNLTTIAAHRGFPGSAAYGASKAALTLLTKVWAVEFGPHGVNVNAIAPGPVRTAAFEGLVGPDGLDQMTSDAPAGRPAEPSEIAAAAVYLASEDSNFVHGETIAVDGGRLAS